MGHGPGQVDQLEDSLFLEKATQIWTLTIRWTYLKGLGIALETAASQMLTAGAADEVADEWVIIHEFSRCLSGVISVYAPESVVPVPLEHLDWEPPNVLRFDLLADLASVNGTNRLLHAASVVRQHLEAPSISVCPLTTRELKILTAVAQGAPIVDVAVSQGYSPRTINRRLKEIRERLSADTTAEAISVVAAQGWMGSIETATP